MTGAGPGARVRGLAAVAPGGAWLWLAVAWGVVLAVLWPSFATMAEQWTGSATYAYGALVVPGALFLAWQRRADVHAAAIRPAPWMLVPLAALLCLWLAGRLTSLQALHHLAAAGVLVLSAWAILGSAVARALAWPLAFLMFLVPEGDFLVPPLMDFTAEFTVALARASGVPVFRDGMLLRLPGGDFEIIAACSGVRFLLASVAIGWFVAGVAFRAWPRRGAFLLAAVLVPLLANGLRAWGIVMLGHLSQMRLIADHVLIGQVFFAAVMFVLCLVGVRHADQPLTGVPTAGAPGPVSSGVAPTAVATAVLAIAAMLLLEPAAAWRAARPLGPLPALPALQSAWQGPQAGAPDWGPAFAGAARELAGEYRRGPDRVAVYMAAYGHQAEGAELVNPANRWFDPDHWRVFEAGGGTTPVPYAEQLLRGPAGERLTRSWYLVDGAPARRPRAAKLRELRDLVSPVRGAGAFVTIGAPVGRRPAEVRTLLDGFMREWCAARVPDGQAGPCGG